MGRTHGFSERLLFYSGIFAASLLLAGLFGLGEAMAQRTTSSPNAGSNKGGTSGLSSVVIPVRPPTQPPKPPRRISCRGGIVMGRACICGRGRIRLKLSANSYWCMVPPKVTQPPGKPGGNTYPPKGPKTVSPTPGGGSSGTKPPKVKTPGRKIITTTPGKTIIRDPGGPVHQKTGSIPKMCAGGRIKGGECVCGNGGQPAEVSPGRFRCSSDLADAGPQTAPPLRDDSYVPGEVLALFNAATPRATIDQVAAEFQLTIVSLETIPALDQTVVRFKVADGQSAEAIADALGNDPRLEGLSFNFLYGLSTDGPPQYTTTALKLPEAHGIANGKSVRIAVIDSGVDDTHPALKGAVAEAFDATGEQLTPSQRRRALRHGTAVASLIAAKSGMTSVAPEAVLLSARAFAKRGKRKQVRGTSFVLVKAIDWALGQEAQILNLSFAGPEDPLLQRILEKAAEDGVIAIAAAGNNGPRAQPAYPAAYENVIAVTALDADNRAYRHANRGSYVAVASPGVDVVTALPGKAYGLLSGTSMAAAHVSGLVALLLEREPYLKGQDVMARLSASARDLGQPGRDPVYGFGLADGFGLLTQPQIQPAQTAASQPK